MIGLIIAILVFNLIAFRINTVLNKSQIAHLWMFTVAYQCLFDLYIDQKYHGYWYFTRNNVDWSSFLTLTVLIAPVNMIFLNWYPFKASRWKKLRYFLYWEVFMLSYELIALLPRPWGYFSYGWWNIWISALVDPILLLTVLGYYKKFILK